MIMSSLIATSMLSSSLGISASGPVWTYKDLFAKSDYIVICTATETKPTGEKLSLASHGISGELIQSITSFKIDHSLKGSVPTGGTISVIHYTSLMCNSNRVIDPPSTISFQNSDRIYNFANLRVSLQRPAYMLFLRSSDKNYHLISGYFRPEDSVKIMAKNEDFEFHLSQK
jgi:hypothetical protein